MTSHGSGEPALRTVGVGSSSWDVEEVSEHGLHLRERDGADAAAAIGSDSLGAHNGAEMALRCRPLIEAGRRDNDLGGQRSRCAARQGDDMDCSRPTLQDQIDGDDDRRTDEAGLASSRYAKVKTWTTSSARIFADHVGSHLEPGVFLGVGSGRRQHLTDAPLASARTKRLSSSSR